MELELEVGPCQTADDRSVVERDLSNSSYQTAKGAHRFQVCERDRSSNHRGGKQVKRRSWQFVSFVSITGI